MPSRGAVGGIGAKSRGDGPGGGFAIEIKSRALGVGREQAPADENLAVGLVHGNDPTGKLLNDRGGGQTAEAEKHEHH